MILTMVGLTPGPLVRARFYLAVDESVGCVSGFGSGIFVPIGVESKCDVVFFVLIIPIGVESKCG